MSIDIVVRKVVELLADHPFHVVAIFMLHVIVFFVFFFRYGGNKGKNPLQNDCRKPPEPFVHDTKVRDSILKEEFKANKVPKNLDAIIIGSGIGGLGAGVLLSRAGKKVLVLEQHDQAGGCCQSFVEKGFEFGIGIQYIGKLHENSIYRVLLDQLTCGQLRWTKLDDAFDTVALGKSSEYKLWSMKSGRKAYYQNLIDLFPKEKAAILAYKVLNEDAWDSVHGFVALKVLPRPLVRMLLTTGLYRLLLKIYRKKYASKTVQQVLDELTDNKELKMVLSYVFGDYAIIPQEVPFIMHAALIHHYFDGAYYPVNGTSEIAFHMIQAIRKEGGSVLMQAPVIKILCDSHGTAIGVRIGKDKVDVYAKNIISDAGVINTFRTLLPEEVARKSEICPLIEKVGQSWSFIIAFFGIDGSSSELKLPAGNIWQYEICDVSKLLTEYFNLKADELEAAEVPFAFISFPSSKDPECEKKYPGRSSALAMTFAKWEWFEEWKNEKLHHCGGCYENLKDIFGRKLWQKCVDLYPQIDGKRVYMEVGTPVTIQSYLARPRGEIYGLDHNRARFSAEVASKLRPDTDIKGLYLTGQDIITCGFAPSLMTSVLCTSQILNRNVHADLLKFRKEILKLDALEKAASLRKEE